MVFVGATSSVDFRKSLFNPFELLVGQLVAATSGHGKMPEQLHLRLGCFIPVFCQTVPSSPCQLPPTTRAHMRSVGEFVQHRSLDELPFLCCFVVLESQLLANLSE